MSRFLLLSGRKRGVREYCVRQVVVCVCICSFRMMYVLCVFWPKLCRREALKKKFAGIPKLISRVKKPVFFNLDDVMSADERMNAKSTSKVHDDESVLPGMGEQDYVCVICSYCESRYMSTYSNVKNLNKYTGGDFLPQVVLCSSFMSIARIMIQGGLSMHVVSVRMWEQCICWAMMVKGMGVQV